MLDQSRCLAVALQELARRLQQNRDGLRVVYMSGYSEHAAAEAAQGDVSVRLLTKPFSRSAMLRTVRELLADNSSDKR